MGVSNENKPYYPTRFNQKKNNYWVEIVKKSKRVITFLDLCGHEKYFKTTIHGIMSKFI
jgi:GTPase